MGNINLSLLCCLDEKRNHYHSSGAGDNDILEGHHDNHGSQFTADDILLQKDAKNLVSFPESHMMRRSITKPSRVPEELFDNGAVVVIDTATSSANNIGNVEVS